jgi:hypothetical protein
MSRKFKGSLREIEVSAAGWLCPAAGDSDPSGEPADFPGTDLLVPLKTGFRFSVWLRASRPPLRIRVCEVCEAADEESP